MGEKEWAPSNVFDVFGDPLARRILVLATRRPMSVEEVAEQVDASLPTIYRRVNALTEYDLLKERRQIDPEGRNYKTFETTLKRIAFEIDESGYDVDVQMRRSLVDQFEDFWSDLERSHSSGSSETDESSGVDPRGDPHRG